MEENNGKANTFTTLNPDNLTKDDWQKLRMQRLEKMKKKQVGICSPIPFFAIPS